MWHPATFLVPLLLVAALPEARAAEDAPLPRDGLPIELDQTQIPPDAPDEPGERDRTTELHEAMARAGEGAPEPQTPPNPPSPVWAVQQMSAHDGLTTLGGSSPSEKGKPRLVLPSGHVEVGTEMAFITSKPFLTEEATELTDVGLWRLRGRRALFDRFEVQMQTQLLAKQPQATSEPLWQGASLGLRAEVVDHFAAGLGASLTPLLNASGWAWALSPGVVYKPEVGRHLRFLLGAAGILNILDYEPNTREAFWFQEMAGRAEVQMGGNDGSFWVGLDYAVPLASNPRSGRPDPERGYLSPPVRLSFELGGVTSLGVKEWEVYASWRVIDRGELNSPESMLPILDGGFDQNQIVLGVQHRFGPKKRAYDQGW